MNIRRAELCPIWFRALQVSENLNLYRYKSVFYVVFDLQIFDDNLNLSLNRMKFWRKFTIYSIKPPSSCKAFIVVMIYSRFR